MSVNLKKIKDAANTASAFLASKLQQLERVRWLRSVMPIIFSRMFGMAFGSILFLLSLIISLPLFLNTSSLKSQITHKVSELFEVDFAIGGDVEISFLPSPRVTIEKAILRNQSMRQKDMFQQNYTIAIEEIEIGLPWFGITKDSTIRKIILKHPVIEVYNQNTEPNIRKSDIIKAEELIVPSKEIAPTTDLGIIGKIFSVNDLSLSNINLNHIPRMIIEDGEVIYYGDSVVQQNINSIEAKILTSEDSLNAEGHFSSYGTISSFIAKINFGAGDSEEKSIIQIASPSLNFKFEGLFSSENRGLLFSDFEGKLNLEIADLQSFYSSYINSSDISSVALKSHSGKIQAEASVVGYKGSIVMNDIIINSPNLSGTGFADIDLNFKFPIIDIDLDLDQLDFSALWSMDNVPASEQKNLIDFLSSRDNKYDEESSTQNQEEKSEDKSLLPTASRLDPVRTIDLTANINIKNIKLTQESIRNFNLYISVSNRGQAMILPLTFSIAKDSNVSISGVFDCSSGQSKFIGQLGSKGSEFGSILNVVGLDFKNIKLAALKDYYLYSDLRALSGSMILGNTYLSINGGKTTILGDIKLTGKDGALQTDSNLKIIGLNLEDHFTTLIPSYYFNEGSLFDKLLWISSSLADHRFKLTLYDTIYDNSKAPIPHQALEINFGKGRIELVNSDLWINEHSNLQASFFASMDDNKPKLTLNMKGSYFAPSTQNKDESGNKIDQENKNQSLGDLKSDGESDIAIQDQFTKPPSNNITLIDRLFSLPSLVRFNGDLDLDLENFGAEFASFKNLKFKAKLKDGILSDIESSGDLLSYSNSDNKSVSLTKEENNPSFEYKGSVAIGEYKTISGNLSLSNMPINPILGSAFSIKNIDGISNISTSFSSNARNRREFLTKLKGEAKFIVASLVVQDYGLTDLVKKMLLPSNYRNELANPDSILFRQGARTIFKEAKGYIKMNNRIGGKLSIQLGAPAINSVLSGTIEPNNRNANLLFNTIFITGNRQKQTPINIVSSISMDKEIKLLHNIDQVRQYLGLPLNHISTNMTPAMEELEKPTDAVLSAPTLEENLKN